MFIQLIDAGSATVFDGGFVDGASVFELEPQTRRTIVDDRQVVGTAQSGVNLFSLTGVLVIISIRSDRS